MVVKMHFNLHGHVNELVYEEQPPGFNDPTCPSHVCRLKRARYSLKQAPRVNRLSNFLLSLGFFCSVVDSLLFIHSSLFTWDNPFTTVC